MSSGEGVPASQTGQRFPDGFVLGVASSSFQIEGGWNEDGKGESMWDQITHAQPEKVLDGSNADVACDSYHLYKEDVKIIKDIGFDFYRFSISWSRILPTGEAHIVNDLGVQYYNNLINELLANGIEPMVTMYHWDLPQRLQDMGGWLNPLIADFFEDYARLLFKLYGDRVKRWITINEPQMVTTGYGNAMFAPCLNMFGYGEYIAAHHILLAHARAYRAYDSDYRAKQQGQISIGLNMVYYFPKTESKADIDAAERTMQFELGWFAEPIYGATGDYPEVMRDYLGKASKKEGRAKSKLPTFTPQEMSLVKGSYDFFAYQHYTSKIVADDPTAIPPPWQFHKDLEIVVSESENWKRSSVSWLHVVPEGFRKALKWISERYDCPPILVSECGYGELEKFESIDDDARIHYFQTYLDGMLRTINEDGCNIIGFTAWSILDNFEWFDGLSCKFGIVKVDYNDPERKRTPKKSAKFFKRLLATRTL